MADAAAHDSPFWRFSLAFYRAPGVADACIDLQDQAGVDVNMLLFLLWNATLRRALARPTVEDLDRRIGAWRDATVIPLRALRRALKSPPPVVEAGPAEAFRTRIKAVELEAERLQQHTMYGLADALPYETAGSPLDAARASVAAYQAIHAKVFPASALATILDRFAAVCDETSVSARRERSA
jgi:uncharacterized protein (TIGR02444 family)